MISMPGLLFKDRGFCQRAPSGRQSAAASATVYSIVESTKENGLNPFAYLKHLFETMPNVEVTDGSVLETLLPWSSDLPPECRSGKQANES